MLNPIYNNPAPLQQPDLYGAVYDLTLTYALPALNPQDIFKGEQELAARPPAGTEYAVVSVLGSIRRGSNVETLLDTGADEKDPETYQIRAYYETVVRIDLYSDSDLGRERAVALESLSRSILGNAFHLPYELTIHYADPLKETSYTDESSQFVRRHSLDLRLGHWSGLDVQSAWLSVGFSQPGLTINRAKGLTGRAR